MYEIHTQTRPGHPRWSIVACAALLLLSLALAAWISGRIQQGVPIRLQKDSEDFPSGHLRVRMPTEWDRVRSAISDIPGVVAVARGRDRGAGTPGEMLIVFRGFPRLNGIPSIDAAEALRQMAGGPDPLIESRCEPARLAGLPGWSIELWADPQRSRGRVSHLGRACLSPDGQIAGIWLTVARTPTAADRRLLDAMSASLELTGLREADTPEQIMHQAGITFAPPADARFFVSTVDRRQPFPRIRLTGGEGKTAWYLTAMRVPLIASRTAHELVEEHARLLAERIALPDPVETATVADRAVFWTQVTLPTNDRPTLLVWGAPIDDRTALMLVGRFEPDGQSGLRAAAEAVTAGSIASSAPDLDVEAALATGREWIGRLSSEGLRAHWTGPSIETTQTQAPAIALRNEVRRYTLNQASDGQRWWQIEIGYYPPSPMIRLTSDIQEEWSIRDDGAAHAGRYRERRGRQLAVNYTELRPPGRNEVYCELALGDEEPDTWTMEVDETYACEPVLLAAAAGVARDVLKRPAVFTSSSPFCTRPLHWIMVPVGEQPLPDAVPPRAAPAVCMVRDCHPLPIVFFYDEDGSLLASSFDDVVWAKPVESQATTKVVPPRRSRPR